MNTLRDAIRHKDFVITADLPLKPVTTVADIREAVATVLPVVDAVQVIDDRDAVGHMSSLAAAAIVLQSDCDAVLHITGRDRNRVALQAEMLGAAALGITSLVLQRGEKLTRKGGLRGKGVFDTKETRLTGMARRIGEESNLVSVPGFLIGTCITVFSPGDDWEALRISESIDAGTRLFFTQPCLNTVLLGRYMDKLIERKILHRASVMVEVPLLGSRAEARKYKKKNPVALIPDATIMRVVEATDPRAEGIAVCAEMLRALKLLPGISGANIRHDGAIADAVAAISAADLA
jgi:methylenetetrahydrofolate reductase (NADPH)